MNIKAGGTQKIKRTACFVCEMFINLSWEYAKNNLIVNKNLLKINWKRLHLGLKTISY
jgi:hypothetical protein